ncbi:MAG TPA: plasmid mobilization relaxosome protein MobC [Mucilaginibacter sp.]|jgi:hypothetical protein
MARPKLTDEQRRSVNFTVRLSPAELKKLDDLALFCGKTPAVLVRDKVFKGKFPSTKMPKLDLETYLELKKIGVNINQLTRLAHLRKVSPALPALLLQLRQQQQQLINLLIEYDRQSENR